MRQSDEGELFILRRPSSTAEGSEQKRPSKVRGREESLTAFGIRQKRDADKLR